MLSPVQGSAASRSNFKIHCHDADKQLAATDEKDEEGRSKHESLT